MRQKSNKKSSVSTLRIIGGQWRGHKLSFVGAEGLRPSGDRVRERVFNWLMHYVAGANCLDLFAGSGALGLEALSRGANHVSFVDNNKATTKQIQQNIDKLSADQQSVSVYCSSADQYLQNSDQLNSFDIIFLDPPFGKNLLPATLNSLHTAKRLKPNGLLYIELENDETAMQNLPENLSIIKDKQSGQVRSLLAEFSEHLVD